MERELREKIFGDPDFFYERNLYEFSELKSSLYSSALAQSYNEFSCLNNPLLDTSKITGRHKFHQRSYCDFKLRISDHLVADHGDRPGFANSIEARYPFLDINLIEFAASIPPELHLKNSIEKYILRKAAEKRLPAEIMNREKFAFVAPGSPYLLRQNIEWVNDILSYNTIKKQGYFNPDAIEHLKKEYMSENFSINQTFDNDILMIVLTFGIFLEHFGKL